MSVFESDVMEKLGRLESGLDSVKSQLLDNGQPGFITKTNTRLYDLEMSDARRTWTERAISATAAFVVSVVTFIIAHLVKR